VLSLCLSAAAHHGSGRIGDRVGIPTVEHEPPMDGREGVPGSCGSGSR